MKIFKILLICLLGMQCMAMQSTGPAAQVNPPAERAAAPEAHAASVSFVPCSRPVLQADTRDLISTAIPTESLDFQPSSGPMHLFASSSQVGDKRNGQDDLDQDEAARASKRVKANDGSTETQLVRAPQNNANLSAQLQESFKQIREMHQFMAAIKQTVPKRYLQKASARASAAAAAGISLSMADNVSDSEESGTEEEESEDDAEEAPVVLHAIEASKIETNLK